MPAWLLKILNLVGNIRLPAPDGPAEMTVARLQEYIERFPVGTPVIYAPNGGQRPLQGVVTSAPSLFRQGFDTCVLTLDDGMVVPCKDLQVATPVAMSQSATVNQGSNE